MNNRLKITLLIFLPLITLVWGQDCCEAEEIATDDCGGLGCYIPQCTENCEWEPMQCWSSTGYCWCVNENGEEIDGTSMPSWEGYPDCEEFNSLIIGDMNGDGGINVLDVVLIIGFIVDADSMSESDLLAGDYNEDGELNVLDIVAIVSLILNPTQLPDECYLEPDPGPCLGYVPIYYFNQNTQSCETFIWGGCAGLVPFQTYTDCVNTCE